MSRTDPPLRVRLPEELKAKIQSLAAENRRSMNAEIVARLERSIQEEVKKPRGLTFAAKAGENVLAKFEERLNDHARRIAALEQKG